MSASTMRTGRQGALVEQLGDAVRDALVDHLLHLRPDLGLLAVADRLEQEVAQRPFLERGAEHVEDLAAVGLALLLDLAQQKQEDVALARVARDEVPEPADLLLADAVDAAEALLDPVRVPGQVVVDHQVRGLQVEALARGVGGEQDVAVLVVGELLGDLAPLAAPDAAVDRADRLVAPEHGADPLAEVLERVAMLGEDDQLARRLAAGALQVPRLR